MPTITKTIGSGGDYTSIALWEADLDNAGVYSSGDIAEGVIITKQSFGGLTQTINGGQGIGISEIILTTNAILKNSTYKVVKSSSDPIVGIVSSVAQGLTFGITGSVKTTFTDIVFYRSATNPSNHAILGFSSLASNPTVQRNTFTSQFTTSPLTRKSIDVVASGTTNINHNLFFSYLTGSAGNLTMETNDIVVNVPSAVITHNTMLTEILSAVTFGVINLNGISATISGNCTLRNNLFAFKTTDLSQNITSATGYDLNVSGTLNASNNYSLDNTAPGVDSINDNISLTISEDNLNARLDELFEDAFNTAVPNSNLCNQVLALSGFKNALPGETDLAGVSRDYTYFDEKFQVTQDHESIGCVYIQPKIVYGIQKTIGSGGDYSTIDLWEADLDNGGVYSSGDKAAGVIITKQIKSTGDPTITINGGTVIGLASVVLTAASNFHNTTAKRITSNLDSIVAFQSNKDASSDETFRLFRTNIFIEDIVMVWLDVDGGAGVRSLFASVSGPHNVTIRRNTISLLVLSSAGTIVARIIDASNGQIQNYEISSNIFYVAPQLNSTAGVTCIRLSVDNSSVINIINNTFHVGSNNTVHANGNVACVEIATQPIVKIINNTTTFDRFVGGFAAVMSFTGFNLNPLISLTNSSNNYSFDDTAPGVNSINIDFTGSILESDVNGKLNEIFEDYTISLVPKKDRLNALATGGLKDAIHLEEDLIQGCRNYDYFDLEEQVTRDHESIGCIYVDPRYIYGVQRSIGNGTRDYTSIDSLWDDATTASTQLNIEASKYGFLSGVHFNDNVFNFTAKVLDGNNDVPGGGGIIKKILITVAVGHRHNNGSGGVTANLDYTGNFRMNQFSDSANIKWMNFVVGLSLTSPNGLIYLQNEGLIDNCYWFYSNNNSSVCLRLDSGSSRMQNSVIRRDNSGFSVGEAVHVSSNAEEIFNCTIHGFSKAIRYTGFTNSLAIVRNCILVGNTLPPDNVVDIEYSITTHVNAYPNSFVQARADAINLVTGEPIVGSAALKVGLDLTSEGNGIEFDMSNQDRNTFTAWDIGAIQTALEPIVILNNSQFFFAL